MPEQVLPADLINRLADGLKPSELPDGLEQRVAARLRAAINPAQPGLLIQRADQGRWFELLPGVQIRILHHDPVRRTVTSLWRLAPGAKLPAHSHEHAEEECLIIDGDIRHGDESYAAGDYMLGTLGSRHGVLSSVDGGSMLLRGSDHLLPKACLLA